MKKLSQLFTYTDVMARMRYMVVEASCAVDVCFWVPWVSAVLGSRENMRLPFSSYCFYREVSSRRHQCKGTFGANSQGSPSVGRSVQVTMSTLILQFVALLTQTQVNYKLSDINSNSG